MSRGCAARRAEWCWILCIFILFHWFKFILKLKKKRLNFKTCYDSTVYFFTVSRQHEMINFVITLFYLLQRFFISRKIKKQKLKKLNLWLFIGKRKGLCNFCCCFFVVEFFVLYLLLSLLHLLFCWLYSRCLLVFGFNWIAMWVAKNQFKQLYYIYYE